MSQILELPGGQQIFVSPSFKKITMPEQQTIQMVNGTPDFSSLGNVLPEVEITDTRLNAFGLDQKTTLLIAGALALGLLWYFKFRK